MSAAPIPVETLLAHREWVRAVARAVVRDPNAADDVEQETWLAALRSPPRDSSSLRGWFGAVTRSRARRIGRSQSRRDARELAAARREATPSAAELAELADTHRRVVQAVVELDEPYRETILLRYFEGLAIDAVAARSGVPLETTRSRLRRGVAKLRDRLAEELGEDDRPWALALVPLIGRPDFATGGVGAAAGGGLLMASTTKTAVAVAAVLLLIGGGAVVAAKWNADDPNVFAAAAEPPPPAPRPERPVAVPRPPRARAEDSVPAPAPPEEPEPPEATVLERLQRVKLTADWTDAPLVGVIAELAARTDVEMVFAKEAYDVVHPDAKLERLSLDQEVGADQLLSLVTQLKGVAWTVEEPRVVIVPAGGIRNLSLPVVVPPKWTPPGPIDVTGRVTDANGLLVTGAEIVQVHADQARRVAATDASGHYAVSLPHPYGSLEARMAGQVRSFTASVSGSPGTQVTLDFALRGVAGSLVVRATTSAGPLAGVVVTLGTDAPGAKTDERAAVQQPLTETTAADGVASFPGVRPGRVAVVCRLAGYEALIRIVHVEAGGRVEVEMPLAAKVPLNEKLDGQRVSFNFQSVRPTEVVKFLNDAKSLSIVVDPAIADRLQSSNVSLRIDDLSLREALRQICEQVGGLTFDVRDKEEIVWIHAAR